MKKFKHLLYTGLAIVGVPFIMVMTIIIVLARNSSSSSYVEDQKLVQPKVDTIVVEKKVIVRDTVFIKPKTKPVPVAPVNDAL